MASTTYCPVVLLDFVTGLPLSSGNSVVFSMVLNITLLPFPNLPQLRRWPGWSLTMSSGFIVIWMMWSGPRLFPISRGSCVGRLEPPQVCRHSSILRPMARPSVRTRLSSGWFDACPPITPSPGVSNWRRPCMPATPCRCLDFARSCAASFVFFPGCWGCCSLVSDFYSVLLPYLEEGRGGFDPDLGIWNHIYISYFIELPSVKWICTFTSEHLHLLLSKCKWVLVFLSHCLLCF